MSDNRLPTEVELVYEVMPCSAMRTAQEPTASVHPCAYFRSWGTYHSYDYSEHGPPPQPGIVQDSVYVGRAPLVPEIVSGCRKTPIMSVGINPNLPGWWRSSHGSVNPLFDDYKQFAHYFRYRAVSKLELPDADYQNFGGGPHDRPLVRNTQGRVVASSFELNVPEDEAGLRRIRVRLQPQKMYEAYQALLSSLAETMGWTDHRLSVGEDLAYGNMVACPSARWTTRSTSDPLLPPMTPQQRGGIVRECFHQRKYFLRQLFHSLPSVLLIFSQSTARAFIGEMQNLFVEGDPDPGEPLDALMERTVRLRYGDLSDGTSLTSRVVFAPHITGNPDDYEPARARVVEQLAEEAEAGALRYNAATGHLHRPRGACVFCRMMEIGDCDYADGLVPLTDQPQLTADSPAQALHDEKKTQTALLQTAPLVTRDSGDLWADTDEEAGPEDAVHDVGAVLMAGEIDEDVGPTYVLRGRIVTVNEAGDVFSDGAIVISNGVIQHVLREGQPIAGQFAAAPVIDTEGTIYPGMIDLHNHYVYNVLPLWVVPRQYSNRSQWPRHPQYKSGVSKPIREALARFSVTAEAIVRFVEAKALISGTTTGQGMRTQVNGGARLFRGAMRNVEETGDVRLPEARTRVPDLSVTGRSGPENIERFRAALEAMSASGGAYFYHLSEGVDEVARRHFRNLQDNDLIQASLVGIHALGLEPEDLDALAEAGAKIVWSPFSNLLLYGKTLSLADVKASGVQVSLGCDWSPSGSKNLLQELKVASFVNQQQSTPLSNRKLVQMVTRDAAEIAGWGRFLGSLKRHALADLLVIAGADDDPYEHLIAAKEEDVRLVTVHGTARYGDQALMRSLHVGPSTDLEPFHVGGAEKALYLHAPGSPINQVSFSQAVEILRDAMADLPAFVAQQESEETRLQSMGVVVPQRFTLEVDNEFVLFDDPLLEFDEANLEAELLADVSMVESLPLEAPVVDAGEDAYWQRIADQPNITDDLKAHLRRAYGLV